MVPTKNSVDSVLDPDGSLFKSPTSKFFMIFTFMCLFTWIRTRIYVLEKTWIRIRRKRIQSETLVVNTTYPEPVPIYKYGTYRTVLRRGRNKKSSLETGTYLATYILIHTTKEL